MTYTWLQNSECLSRAISPDHFQGYWRCLWGREQLTATEVPSPVGPSLRPSARVRSPQGCRAQGEGLASPSDGYLRGPGSVHIMRDSPVNTASPCEKLGQKSTGCDGRETQPHT